MCYYNWAEFGDEGIPETTETGVPETTETGCMKFEYPETNKLHICLDCDARPSFQKS